MVLDLTKNKLPPEEQKALLEGVSYFRSFQSTDPVMQQMLRDASGGEGQAWQVFTLGVPDVLEGGKGLGGVKLGGWRIAVRSGENVIAGDIYTGATVERRYPYSLKAGTPRLACIRSGEEISEMLNRMGDLSKRSLYPDIPDQPFQLQILLLPGLVTEALWLQPPSPPGGISYLVPFNTRVRNLDAGKAYPEDLFLKTMRPVAEIWDKYRSSPYSGDGDPSKPSRR
jgi:hypothetical protein